MEHHGSAPEPLPREILGLVVDELQGSKQSLINCSLASRSLLPFSRQHLFRTLRVGFPIQKPLILFHQSTEDSLNFLLGSDIGSYVRDLRIGLSIISRESAGARALVLFLKELREVHSLTFGLDTGFWSVPEDSRWGRLALAVPDFLDFLQSQPLATINVRNIRDFPCSLLLNCHRLRRLTLDGVSFLETSKNPASSGDSSNQQVDLALFELLDIMGATCALDLRSGPSYPLRLSTLCCLGVRIATFHDFLACQTLIQASSESLCDVRIGVSRQASRYFAREGLVAVGGCVFDFGSCGQLSRIDFEAYSCDATSLRWAMACLDTVAHKSLVRDVALPLQLQVIDLNDWKLVDSLLTGPKFPHLRSLKVRFRFLPPDRETVFPGLMSKGLIRYV